MAESHREEIAKLEALHATNPEGRVFTHLAEAYRKAGELEHSREILERGLQRHGDYASAHVVLGRVLMDMGDPAAARASFRRVLELDRHNLIALRSLGELASAASEPEEALGFYRELLALDPGDDRARTAVSRLEREAEAARAAAQAAESTPAELAPGEAEPEPTFEPIAFPSAEATEPEPETETAGVSLNWEEDAAVPQEAFPGDLAVFAGEEEVIAPGAAVEETEPEWRAAEDFTPASALGADESGEPELTRAEPEPIEMPGEGGEVGPVRHEEVVTETMAELYTAQGLHDRAAEVYRALLRERPEDQHLSARLRESEAAARRAEWSVASPASEADIFAATSASEAEDSPSWLEGVESAWTGGAGVAGGGPTPYAWTDTPQSEESRGGVRIADYFRDLLGWQLAPGAAAAPAEMGEEEPTLLLMDEVVEEETPSQVEASLPPLADEASQTPEEDEDLEMFRSWLQSLKK